MGSFSPRRTTVQGGYSGPKRQQSFLTENGTASLCKGNLTDRCFQRGFSQQNTDGNLREPQEQMKKQGKHTNPSLLFHLEASKYEALLRGPSGLIVSIRTQTYNSKLLATCLP